MAFNFDLINLRKKGVTLYKLYVYAAKFNLISLVIVICNLSLLSYFVHTTQYKAYADLYGGQGIPVHVALTKYMTELYCSGALPGRRTSGFLSTHS